MPVDRRLPRPVHVLQSGLVVNAFGNGAANPFTIIYLHDVRGIPLAVAGAASATNAFAALLATLWGGALADRIGSRAALAIGLSSSASAFALYPLVREPWHAFVIAVLGGSGGGVWITGQGALLAKVTPPELRHSAFAQQRVAANVGLGLGGLVGGIVAGSGAWTPLFLGNALTFLLYAAVISRLPEAPPVRRPGGYGVVFRDAVLGRVALLNVAYVTGGIALMTAFLPVFAKNEVGVGERAIGFLYLLNSAAIIGLQMPISRSQEGRRRARSLALIGGIFAATWVLVGVADGLAVLAVAVVLFSVGECVYDAVYGPLVAGIAPEGLTGRYLAVSGFAWQLGFIAGPGVGGAALAAAPEAFWLGAFAVCLAGGGAALTLERSLPEAERRTALPARVA